MERLNKIIIFFTLLLISSTYLSAQLSGDAITQLRKSTVRIKSGNKVSTGFLWKNNNWVVTTLHSIDEASNIRVTLVNQARTAKVVKVLKRYDLALLELDQPVDLPILTNSQSSAAVNSQLYVLGYNGKGNLSNIIDRSIRLGYNHSGKLNGLLSKKLTRELNTCKSPDPEIDILYFDGSLLPGFSGAPIVNNAGKLVGIADGGLEEGAQSISWGIEGRFLNNLVASSEQFQGQACSVQSRTIKFSTENLQDDLNIDYVSFKGYKFIKTKTRTIAQMQNTVDDPLGLNQLINGFALSNNLNYANFAYDIYTDINSGATFCVPEGVKPEVRYDLLVAQEPGSEFAYIVWVNKAINNGIDRNTQHQNSSLVFEQKLVNFIGMNLTYQADVNFSYAQPVFKPNGLIVNRKAYYGYQVNAFGAYYPQSFLFETHVVFGDTYLGMAAVHLKNDQNYQSNLNSCVFSGQCIGTSAFNQCNDVCQKYKTFSQLSLGVHMGGFSNIGY